MKKVIYITTILLCNYLYAQTNLVINPSLEIFSTCPVGVGEAYKATDWDSFTGSSDYFNPCASQSSAQTPGNDFGYQTAYHGSSYGGLITYYNSTLYREILGVALQTPLIVSQKYYFSFMVCRGSDNAFVGYSTNKIGIKLTKTNSYTVNISNYSLTINNTANYATNMIITDTLNWTRIKGSIVADSAYQYLMIGNFFDDANTTITNQSGGTYAYYYIDNVCLSTDSTFAHEYITNIKEKHMQGELSIYPNPVSDKLKIKVQSDSDLKIESIYGKVITNVKIQQGETIIDVGGWDNAIYFITINKQRHKIIINH